jgi:hypothetical protein
MKPFHSAYKTWLNHSVRVLACCAAVGAATAQTVRDEQSIKQLLETAVLTGKSQGYITGDIAAMFQKEFKTMRTVEVRAVVIKQFKRKDCKRISVVLEIPGVSMTDKNGKKLDARTTTEINLCADGLPPSPQEQ